MTAPTIRLTATVTAIKGAQPVTVSAYFSATRPLEQSALDAFSASQVEPGGDDPAKLREGQITRLAALRSLFDASCLRVGIIAQGDMEERQATVADVAGGVKLAMVMKLIEETEVRLNEPGQ